MRKLTFTLLVLLFTTISIAQFTADPRAWELEELVGMDPVSDCDALTGNISSVFAKITSDNLLLRVTFDNMIQRKDHKQIEDYFEEVDVELEFIIEGLSAEVLMKNSVNVSSLSGNKKEISYLRTPASNLLEIQFPWKGKLKNIDDLNFSIRVFINEELVDLFHSPSPENRNGGNCAFVHHGNQGLTYTSVFYGQGDMETSGFDEVLEVHVETNTPGNFHMSGTLMPAAEWHNPEFNDWLTQLAAEGKAAMMTSALGQHIMPFLTNEMNDWSVYIETQMVNYRYNYFPKVAWVPERVWLGQGYYPDAGVIDWIGDNWEQHGVEAVVLDDLPHLSGYDNHKIHWMNNGSNVNLRVIPIDNDFVGKMHYDAEGAKDHIASMGQYNLCVYGTDWEVAAEMNEHYNSFFLDNYIDVLWYCSNNYPAINVWKLDAALYNPDFNGTGANLTKGTYWLLGGTDGYGGSNNSWYSNWASTPSHSDFHDPQWNYGTVWWDAYSFLDGLGFDNGLSQLGWYTMMINLHETGWHTTGEVSDWIHRYSSHIKNANVYTEASRWAEGLYEVNTACYYDDIDHDGGDELVIHNDKVFMVFEGIGGKANWVFYKNGYGEAYSVVSSDVAYWSETEGDYNENGSLNHFAALSDVSPNQQDAIYNINIIQSFGDTVMAELDQWGVKKTIRLVTGTDYLDVMYDFYGQTGYVKSGWTPDLLDIIWSGRSHLQRLWGDYGSYCGYRNSASGATAALVLGSGGASHNGEFEGTLVKGDEIYGYDQFFVRFYAGYTSEPTGTTVSELNALAAENMDVFPPELFSPAVIIDQNAVLLSFSEALELSSCEDVSNYNLSGFSGVYTIASVERQADWNKVRLEITGNFIPGDVGEIQVFSLSDLSGNVMTGTQSAQVNVPVGATPHSIIADDGIMDFLDPTEIIEIIEDTLFITWDENNLYVALYAMDLNSEGDFFVNIDTDQLEGSGADEGSWGRVDFAEPYLPEYQVAIEGGGGSIQLNNYTTTKGWNYPGLSLTSYEGWVSNPLTEFAIPWSELGNPEGFALSAHVSEEDTEIVYEIFPGVNSIGDHPTITHWCAFFEPLLPGQMPLAGFIPADVVVVPNSNPVINTYSPLNLEISIEAGNTQEFLISATDPDGDDLIYTWLLDGIEVGSASNYFYLPDILDVGNHSLEVVVSDLIPGNQTPAVIWDVEVVDGDEIQVSLKVFLEGPYDIDEMQTGLNDADFIPLNQPYNTTPWNYSGTESVVSIPGINTVDWVLIELRDAPTVGDAVPSTMIAQQAAFVQDDGTIIGVNGADILNFNVSLTDELFVLIWHRDHIPIISNSSLTETDGIFEYDFTTAAAQAYGNNQVDLGNGEFGMISADMNADGSVDENDLLLWEQFAGERGYLPADANMDAEVNNQDKNDLWDKNEGDTQILPQ